MPPLLALFFGTVFVIIAFRSDRKLSFVPDKELFWPTLWYLVVASHPLGFWLMHWGIPLPGGGDDPTEGSLADRLFYGVLMVIGLRILARRNFNWGSLLRNNPWLTALVAFMAVSIVWSQFPFVSFKRYIKVIGSITMAMVVLTSESPLESILTVLRRVLYIHLPMSIICTRYFRDIGVSFEWDGTAETWEGISTSKNTLGQISMIGVLYFFWEVRRRWADCRWKNLHVLYLLMAVYLLKGSPKAVSMTSVVVCTFSLFVFLGLQSLRARRQAARFFGYAVFGMTATLVLLVVTHSVVMFEPDSIFGQMITAFGRDITLTDRTYIWAGAYAAVSNPLLGVGYGGFWIGRIANIPWNAQMSWVLGQAHSGYVDTYLQIGLVGSFFLAAVILSSVPRLLNSLDDDYDMGCFRITLFLTIIFINITESVYLRGDHHLWFILMVVLWCLPPRNASAAPENSPSLET